ncbi:MAG: 2-amino-4-hydroxy-6-hydroxymethyldihydropteridine diphosphokinase [Thiomargarita sp.]|nr:2-amino-4-hydroxy-6-hydroxymethyldihydropteridine diphosphokinase [Thiomargarita sp.]
MLKVNIVYIGLGSNLNQPIEQIKRALQTLQIISDSILKQQSSLYQTAPLGSQNQPDYINAVAMLVTKLNPLDLLDELQKIELQHGRVRTQEKWEARSLDLDILLYNNDLMQHPQLILPHPGLYLRSFVLIPLYECNPNLILPNGKTIFELTQVCSSKGIKKILTL